MAVQDRHRPPAPAGRRLVLRSCSSSRSSSSSSSASARGRRRAATAPTSPSTTTWRCRPARPPSSTRSGWRPAAPLLCLLVGFPLAYYLATRAGRKRTLLLVLVVVPFWTSFLIRTYAWLTILGNNGIPAWLEALGFGARRAAEHAVRGPARDRLQLPAADGVPALRQPRAARQAAPRGIQGPRRGALGDVPAGDPAALLGRAPRAGSSSCSSRSWASTSSRRCSAAARSSSSATRSWTCSSSPATGRSGRPLAIGLIVVILIGRDASTCGSGREAAQTREVSLL